MKNHIYLDYAAATPLDTGVEAAMRPYYGRVFGNPSSAHWLGQEASAAVFRARQAIAQAIGADYKEIIFTGSATEANNLALRGAVAVALQNHPQYASSVPFKIIISAIEHESVIEPCRVLEKEYGVEVARIPVGHTGIINLQKLKAALNEQTILVSMQYANSEIGVIQPIQQIYKILSDFRDSRFKIQDSGIKNRQLLNLESRIMNHYPLFHIDAAQAFQYLPCTVDELGVDMMTLSAHKIYGPKGIGALYVRGLSAKNYQLKSLITGGGQEQGIRAGTENVPAIMGFGAAVALAEKMRVREARRVGALRDYLWEGIKKIVSDAEINGLSSGGSEIRLSSILNVYFPGRSAQDVCIELDLQGIAVSPGSACSSRAAQPSQVIAALGFSGDRPSSSIRFSLGRPTTKAEINTALTILKKRFKK